MSKTPAVLIVEDDLAIRHLLEAVVHRHELTSVAAGDGEAALHHLERTDFAVILLDLFLSKIDGWEILRRLDLATPHLLRRIIVVTAASEAEYASLEPIRSVRCVFHKPFELAALEEQLLACHADTLREKGDQRLRRSAGRPTTRGKASAL